MPFNVMHSPLKDSDVPICKWESFFGTREDYCWADAFHTHQRLVSLTESNVGLLSERHCHHY